MITAPYAWRSAFFRKRGRVVEARQIASATVQKRRLANKAARKARKVKP